MAEASIQAIVCMTRRPLFIACLKATRYKGHYEGHLLDLLAELYVTIDRFYNLKGDEWGDPLRSARCRPAGRKSVGRCDVRPDNVPGDRGTARGGETHEGCRHVGAPLVVMVGRLT